MPLSTKASEKNNLNAPSRTQGNGQHYIYIVLSRPRSVVANVIQAYTKDTYTHSAISFDPALLEMYSFTRKWSYYPFLGRLNNERFDVGLLKRCPTLPGLVIKLSITKDKYEKAKSLVERMISEKKLYKYDMKGFFGNLFNYSIENETRFTCSKFVAFILRECEVAEFSGGLNLIRPQMLLSLKGEVVFQGDLKVYQKDFLNLAVN